ncbi:hypothetical protein [Brucella anthropi]
MAISVETLRKLMAAGLEGEALLEVVASIENDHAPRARSANAERQARYRANKRNNGDVTECVTNNVTDNVTLNPSLPNKKEPPVPQEKINPPAQPRAHTCEAIPDDDLQGLQSKLTAAAGDKIQPHGVFDLSAIIGLISAGVDVDTDILPTIRARAATMQRPAKGWNYFTDAIKDAHNRRIKAGEGLAKPVRVITPDTELAPEILEAEWTKRLGYARRNSYWNSVAWGPMPGDDGCRVPSNLLQPTDGKDRYGVRWDDQSKRAA